MIISIDRPLPFILSSSVYADKYFAAAASLVNASEEWDVSEMAPHSFKNTAE